MNATITRESLIDTTWTHANPSWPAYLVRTWADSEAMVEIVDASTNRVLFRDYPEIASAKLERNGYTQSVAEEVTQQETIATNEPAAVATKQRPTIASTIIDRQVAAGMEYVGMTSGWCSFRKGSNLRAFLDRHDLTPDEVAVFPGARKRCATEGTQLLVFRA